MIKRKTSGTYVSGDVMGIRIGYIVIYLHNDSSMRTFFGVLSHFHSINIFLLLYNKVVMLIGVIVFLQI